MNIKNITITAIAAFIVTTASLAETNQAGTKKAVYNKSEIVSSMIANYDQNHDGALDSAELAASIEGLYEMRQNAFRNHRETMVAHGVVTSEEASNGIITLSLLPEDGAAILMRQADKNHDHVLAADELMESTRIWPTLSLGARPYRGNQS